MSNNIANCVLVAAILILASQCATITRGTKDTLVVESDPPGATVTLSKKISEERSGPSHGKADYISTETKSKEDASDLIGKTPASFKLPRGEALVVKIEKEGYEPVQVNVTPQTCNAGGAGMAGNICLGGCIGAGIDAGSGAMQDLKPNPISVRLVKISEVEPVPEASTHEGERSITERIEELQHLLEKGIITEEEFREYKLKILEDM